MDETPGAIKHITNSIKTGKAQRISQEVSGFDGLARNREQLDTAYLLNEYYNA